MRVLRRVVVATLSTALVLLGTSFVLAPAAHADCLMIGHADLGAAPALLHNPASQGDCNGYFRMFGYLQDKSADNRTAKLRAQGIRSDGYILWTRNASASGYGTSTHFDWTNARVHHVYVCVWAENTWGPARATAPPTRAPASSGRGAGRIVPGPAPRRAASGVAGSLAGSRDA